MRRSWRKSGRSRTAVRAAIALGVVLLALPLMPSLRRYVLMESM